MAALALQEFEKFDSQAQVRAAIENVAARLGNTRAICRKCYVHPEICGELRDDLAMLKPEEAAVLTILELRLGRDLKIALKESVEHPNLVH